MLAKRTLLLVFVASWALPALSTGTAIFRDGKHHQSTITQVGDNLEINSPKGCAKVDGVCIGNLPAMLQKLIEVNTANSDKVAGKIDKLTDAMTSLLGLHQAGQTKEVAALMGAKGSMDSAPWTLTVSPSSTFIGGGELLTITGKNFDNADFVWFGTEKQQTIERMTDTTIRVRAPLHAAGLVDITVGGAKGYFRTLYDGLTFTAKSTGPPDVRFATSSKSTHATNNHQGDVGGGYVIDVLGSGFADGGENTVEFVTPASDMDGTQPGVVMGAVHVTTKDDNVLKVMTPKFARLGWFDIVVKNSKGESRLARGFDVTQEKMGRNSFDLYVDRSVSLDGSTTHDGSAEVGIRVTHAPLDGDAPTSIHIGDISIAQADIRIDTAVKMVYFKPGSAPRSMLGFHTVSMVHGRNHYMHADALIYTEVGPGALGAHTVSGSEVAGLSVRLYSKTRRRRRRCYTQHRSGTITYNCQWKHQVGKNCQVGCKPYGVWPQGELPIPVYPHRTLKPGDTSFIVPMNASNGPDNAGHTSGVDQEFTGWGAPFKITAQDGTPCKTVRQTGGHDQTNHTLGSGCMTEQPGMLVNLAAEIGAGSKLTFWNERGEWGTATVASVAPNTAGTTLEWSPGDLTIHFKNPFACSGGGPCFFAQKSWMSVVPQFKELTVPKGAVLSAPRNLCSDHPEHERSASEPKHLCNDEPPLLALDMTGTLKVDGAVDMSGVASQCSNNFGTSTCGEGGISGGHSGSPGPANPSGTGKLRAGSCGGSGGGAEAECWGVVSHGNGQRRRGYRTLYDSKLIESPAQPGSCGPAKQSGNTQCERGGKDDWNTKCKTEMGFGGDGGNGGGVMIINAKAITGTGTIAADGEPGQKGQPRVVDTGTGQRGVSINSHQPHKPLEGCQSETAGGKGGSGSGGVLQVHSDSIGSDVSLSAAPHGKVWKR